jgi:regulator of sigma E protease
MESIPVGLLKERPISRIRKTIKMIFSPSTGAYKQVGGFKAILIFFQYLELETFWRITALLSIMLG